MITSEHAPSTISEAKVVQHSTWSLALAASSFVAILICIPLGRMPVPTGFFFGFTFCLLFAIWPCAAIASLVLASKAAGRARAQRLSRRSRLVVWSAVFASVLNLLVALGVVYALLDAARRTLQSD